MKLIVKNTHSNQPQENKFDQEQPLRHPLAAVALDNDQLKINKQLYQVIVNKDDALDLELLRQNMTPILISMILLWEICPVIICV